MKTVPFLAFAALFAGAAAAAPQLWATVPASRQAGRIEVFPLPDPLGESVVTLVGASRNEQVAAVPKVEAMTLDLPVAAIGAVPSAPEPKQCVLPPEAIWPGPDGRISVPPDTGERPGAGASLRNPWEIRIRPRRELAESTFLAGGTIEGGASPVALLNGRVAQPGASFDGFEVSAVTASAVLLRKDGRSYVIPLGRRVTIETVQP